MKNIKRFANFCGQDGMKNIILVTTMWGELKDPAIGELREKELKESFWKEMLAHGCRTARFEDTCGSAWRIVGSLSAAEFPTLHVNNGQHTNKESSDVYPGGVVDDMDTMRTGEEDGEQRSFKQAEHWLSETS